MTPSAYVRPGINEALFRLVVESPPDWVVAVTPGENDDGAYGLPALRAELGSFLAATTDSVRLVEASAASRRILKGIDSEELEDLRASVQLSELLRVVPYARQTDHSAHTLYVFLLGWHFFLTSERYRFAFRAAKHKKSGIPGDVARFNLQWIFASLLHDVGYVFQGRPRTERRAVDRMFRASSVVRTFGETASPALASKIRSLIEELEPPRPCYERIDGAEATLDQLRMLPWGKSIGLRKDTFEVLETEGMARKTGMTSRMLEEYGYAVAAAGYDGLSEGLVDHAIASGLFLLQYSTFFYWLAKETSFEGPFSSYKDDYPLVDIIDACFAAAAHNVLGLPGKPAEPLKVGDDPILYLSVLCDEIQKWDRFPAGLHNLPDLRAFARSCTDSERVAISVEDGRTRLAFEVQELAESIEGKLSERLVRHGDFIEIDRGARAVPVPGGDGPPRPREEPSGSEGRSTWPERGTDASGKSASTPHRERAEPSGDVPK